jgi:NAD(P)-dependent dehydrogenase (short-subunit alcohol dehydrogenase family)
LRLTELGIAAARYSIYCFSIAGVTTSTSPSVHASEIIPKCFPHPIAKQAVVGVSGTLDTEYANRICINAISPGYSRTEIVEDLLATAPDTVKLGAETNCSVGSIASADLKRLPPR